MADTSYGNKYEDDSSDVEPMDVDCGSSKIASADEAGSSGGSSKKRRTGDIDFDLNQMPPEYRLKFEMLLERVQKAEHQLDQEAERRKTAEHQLAEKDAQLAEKDDEIYRKSVDFLIEEVKKLIEYENLSSITPSDAATNHWNQAAALVPIASPKFSTVTDLKRAPDSNTTTDSAFLSRVGRTNPLTWGSENDIASEIKLVVIDVLRYLGIGEEKVGVYTELSVVGLRPDIWLIFDHGKYRIPFAVLEVKKPDRNNEKRQLENGHFAGQLYSYMMMLKEIWGIQNPIGIMSTFRYWRVCTLGKDDWEVLGKKENPTDFRLHVNYDEWLSTDEVESEVGYEESEGGDDDLSVNMPAATLYCTEAFYHQSEGLFDLLVNALWRAVRADQIPVNPLAAKLVIRYDAKTGKCVWQPNPWKEANVLKLSLAMPQHNCSTFYLVRDLRYGAHGRVWVAASKAGKVCVLKFPAAIGGLQYLEKEEHLWRIMLPKEKSSIRVLKRGELNASERPLVIPYCRPLTKAECESDVIRERILENITKLLENGWDHGDLIIADKKTFKWHHVGIYKQDLLCLLDFGAAKKIDPPEVDDYVQKYKAVLFPE